MLDHYFSTHSLKESVHYCHADNCLVKARIGLSLVTLLGLVLIVWVKTRIGLSLVTLLGLVLTGKHTQINLSFTEVGHTRCLVAGHFARNHIGAWIVIPLKHLIEATHRSTVYIFLSYLQSSGKLRKFS